MQRIDTEIMRRAAFAAFLLIGLFLAGATQSLAQTASIGGEWDAEMSTPGGIRSFKIVFVADGEKLTGTVKRSAGDVPLSGTIKGNDLQFSYSVSYNGNELTLSMTGKLDGDKIAGMVFFGESGQSDSWSAKRAAAAK